MDFPNLCDLHTLIIHPSYERLARSLGFQKTSYDPKVSVYRMYLALDRSLALDAKHLLASARPGDTVASSTMKKVVARAELGLGPNGQ
ncbi:hypothetical protein [Rubidibacter lacunae]|uniref:hypothetical protein n=1 Tax=Rubidibacter lacunae TaxID=582514 RepID=UPI00041FFF85|nr:hypothetical protein [Rubidibacter lacunae]